MKPEVILIAALGPYEIIGIADKMAWHSKQDFYHFKKQTNGYPCIFGDKTFFGLPKYPLKNRLNIVASFNHLGTSAYTFEAGGGCVKVESIEDGIQYASNYDKVFICGGAGIYKYCIEKDLIDTFYLTRIISPKLEEQFRNSQDAYIKFPIAPIELYNKGWSREIIQYEEDELPEEHIDMTIQFQKYTRLKK